MGWSSQSITLLIRYTLAVHEKTCSIYCFLLYQFENNLKKYKNDLPQFVNYFWTLKWSAKKQNTLSRVKQKQDNTHNYAKIKCRISFGETK